MHGSFLPSLFLSVIGMACVLFLLCQSALNGNLYNLFLLCVFTVPIDATAGIKMLYVFVDIQMDTAHFLDTLRFNFSPGRSLALVSTIQFVAALQVTFDLAMFLAVIF